MGGNRTEVSVAAIPVKFEQVLRVGVGDTDTEHRAVAEFGQQRYLRRIRVGKINCSSKRIALHDRARRRGYSASEYTVLPAVARTLRPEVPS